jgi:hypothetical protein
MATDANVQDMTEVSDGIWINNTLRKLKEFQNQ